MYNKGQKEVKLARKTKGEAIKSLLATMSPDLGAE